MGDVVPFPRKRTRLRKKPFWRVVDLLGKRPRGHISPAYGPRGRVIMAPGQVWVEGHNQRLWVIRKMTSNKKRKGSLYPHDIVLCAYRGKEMRCLAETGVRLNMRIWEVHSKEMKETMDKLAYLADRPTGAVFLYKIDTFLRKAAVVES